MAHFSTGSDYRGPAADLGKSSESEKAGAGVAKYGEELKSKGDTKDQRPEGYRGPGAKLKTE